MNIAEAVDIAMFSVKIRGDISDQEKQETIRVLKHLKDKCLASSNQWELNTEEDWINCFRTQFNKHKDENISSKRYDLLRDKDTPTWGTIARHLGIVGWNELMELASVYYPNKTKTAESISIKSVHSPTLKRFEELNRQREKQMQELYDITLKIKA